MAYLDDLVDQIKDPVLRQKMTAALADMKRRQRFGLVFEQHIPETSALLGLPVQVGSIVQRRDVFEANGLHRVMALNGRTRAKRVYPGHTPGTPAEA